MKPNLLLTLLALAGAPVVFFAADTKGAEKTVTVQRHPLRGVITNVFPDKSAMMVKHEEVPGVMRAMTMMFHVDAATLKAFKPGDAITALMSRQGTIWKLEEVKPVATTPAK